MIDLTDLLTDAEAGALLHKGPVAVRKLRLKGKLAFLPGRPPRTPRAVVLAYLAEEIKPRKAPGLRPRVRLQLRH